MNTDHKLQDTLNSDGITMDNALAYAIAHKFGDLSDFNELCSSKAKVSIFSFTEGFSSSEMVEFYHAHKNSLLKHLRAHSQSNGYICGFDWVDSAMIDKGYDRDETARAMYEGLIDGVAPTNAHIDIVTIIVHLAAESLIEAHQEQIALADA